MQGSTGAQNVGANLAFTKFIFVTPANEDEPAMVRLRAAAAVLARGFFNDFEAGSGRDTPPHETVQFFVSEQPIKAAGIAGAPYALQVSSKYRPRLDEGEIELRRRLGDDFGEVLALDGAVRVPQYTSAQMHAFAYQHAGARASGRTQGNVIILPLGKTKEWWDKSALDRHAYFYPHEAAGGRAIKGHARAAEAGIPTIYRRLFYNPDGTGRPGEFDFITYFECADEHVATFNGIRAALADERQNPEWRFVVEGPEWRGRRVLKW